MASFAPQLSLYRCTRTSEGATRTGAMLSQYRRQALPVYRFRHEIGGAQWDRHATLIENGHHDHGYVTQLGVGLEFLERSPARSEEHTSELQSQSNLVCRLLLEKKKKHTAALYAPPI